MSANSHVTTFNSSRISGQTARLFYIKSVVKADFCLLYPSLVTSFSDSRTYLLPSMFSHARNLPSSDFYATTDVCFSHYYIRILYYGSCGCGGRCECVNMSVVSGIHRYWQENKFNNSDYFPFVSCEGNIYV